MNTSIHQFSIAARSIAVSCAVVALSASFVPAANATLIQYLDITGIPASTGTVYFLPNYGNVRMTVSPLSTTTTSFTVVHQTAAENKSAGPYTWGADTDRFNVLRSNSVALDYDVTFDFLDGATDPSRLILVIAGLLDGTTATVSAAGSLVGEYQFASTDLVCGAACPGGSSPTTIDSSGKIFSSGYTGSAPLTDIRNTGWALDRLSGATTSLKVDFHQLGGDGIGWTLAYASVPEPGSLGLVGLGLGLAGLGISRRKV